MNDRITALQSMINDLQDALRATRSEYSTLSPTALAYFDLLDSEIACLHGDIERLSQFLPVQPQQETQS